jgi:redox-sensitive bicupin YhaK (pirin superfamily)
MKTNQVNEKTQSTGLVSSRKLKRIYTASNKHWVGNGFPVYSIFDYNGLGRELSPFLMLDYAEPYEFTPGDERRGVAAHPHKGFETVTIAYQGEIEHRDSSGGGGKIGPGDVQWMTAGKGIIHEEFHSAEFTSKGGTFQMIQLWVNLPKKDKDAQPGYQTLLKNEIPTVVLPGEAGRLRVIAGNYNGTSGPAKTFTAINLWDVQLNGSNSFELSSPEGHSTAILLLKGGLQINNDVHAKDRDLIIFEKQGEVITLKGDQNSHFLLLGGEPIAEPIVGAGPFFINNI